MKKSMIYFAFILLIASGHTCFASNAKQPMPAKESRPSFDYDTLDDMSLEELEKLQDIIKEKISEKNDPEPVQWEEGNHFGHNVYYIGDTWKVDGLWELTFDSVIETTDGLDIPKEKPEVMYLVTFTLKNIGYVHDVKGLCLRLGIGGTVSDSEDEIGECYLNQEIGIPGVKIPKDLPIGTHGTFTEAIGVKHQGDLTLTIHKEGNNNDNHVAVFYLKADK